jgi:thymidylate kinase
MNKKPIVIAVEGIVGVGKTTIIERCLESLLTKKGYRVKIIKEPVDQFCHCFIAILKDMRITCRLLRF